MQARIEFHDGLIVELRGIESKTVYSGRVVCEITANDVLRIHNLGCPNPVSLNPATQPQWAGAPVYLKSVLAQHSAKVPELFGLNAMTKLLDTVFVLLDQTHPKVPASGLPLSNEFHLLDGSDCYMVRFIDPVNTLVTPSDAGVACLGLLNLDTDLLAQPRLSRLLGFYTTNLESFNPSAVERTFGWWLWPASYNKRWGGSPPLSYLQSHYGFISTWATSDGLTCEHYDHPLYFLIKFLTTGDALALELGLMLLRKKICYGLYDINDTAHPYYGQWKWEKGNRLGFFMAPSSAKEWDTSLVIASKICPEPIFDRALKVRSDSLLQRTNYKVWPRAGGGREAGRYLQNLFIMAKANVLGKQEAYKAKAESFLNYFFGALRPTERWIPNDYAPTYTDAWEGMTFFYYAMRWMKDYGVAAQHEARMVDMLDWYCTNGIGMRHPARGIAQAHYHVFTTGSPVNTSENAVSHLSFWYKLWPYIQTKFGTKYQDIGAAAKSTVVSYIGRGFGSIDAGSGPILPTSLQVDYQELGPSGEKQWPMFLEMAVRL